MFTSFQDSPWSRRPVRQKKLMQMTPLCHKIHLAATLLLTSSCVLPKWMKCNPFFTFFKNYFHLLRFTGTGNAQLSQTSLWRSSFPIPTKKLKIIFPKIQWHHLQFIRFDDFSTQKKNYFCFRLMQMSRVNLFKNDSIAVDGVCFYREEVAGGWAVGRWIKVAAGRYTLEQPWRRPSTSLSLFLLLLVYIGGSVPCVSLGRAIIFYFVHTSPTFVQPSAAVPLAAATVTAFRGKRIDRNAEISVSKKMPTFSPSNGHQQSTGRCFPAQVARSRR